MACLLTKGRALPCRDSVGGLKSAYLVSYGTLGALTVSSGKVTAMAGSPTVMKYDLKGNSSLEQTITGSTENGTVFYEQTLNLTLTKQQKESQEEIKLVAQNRPHIFVEDYNGNYFLVGAVHGADLNAGTISSGAAMGDLSGYTLTFSAQETIPAYFVDSTVVTGATQGTQLTP
tara:strand:- start:293 stop:814 length:522 start_codon:yes stop_codon:yes gene_type:complete